MYYNWPIEVSLLDEGTRDPVWRATFAGVDILLHAFDGRAERIA